MLKKMSTIILLLLLTSVSRIFTDESFGFEGEISFSKPYMFVSLGHNCHLAQATRFPAMNNECDLNDIEEEMNKPRSYGLRDAAFPFDWLITVNVEKLVLCLDEHFERFSDESCFFREGDLSDVTNVRYDCKFTHDWPFHYGPVSPELHSAHIAHINQKYARRIARFESLKSYKGKMFFMRSFASDLDYQNDSALKLRDALRRFFPNLNFTLVIVNWTGNSIFKAGLITDVKEYFLSGLTNFGDYDVIFNDLLKEEQRG